MTTSRFIAAALYLVPMLLWTVIARRNLAYVRRHAPRSAAFRLFPVVSFVLAVHYLVLALAALLPWVPLHPFAMLERPGQAMREVPWLITVAILRHIVAVLPLPERQPSRTWLVTNYGLAVVAAGAVLVLRGRPDATPEQQVLAHRVYELTLFVLGGLCLKNLIAVARPGGWGPEHAGELRRRDVTLIVGGVMAAFAIFPTAWGLVSPEFSVVGFEVVLGIAIALPGALRMLGVAVVEFVTLAVVLAATLLVVAGIVGGTVMLPAPLWAALVLASSLALYFLLTTGQTALRGIVARALVGTNESQWRQLQDSLHTLSPEVGVLECCRSGLAEIVRIRGLPGGAILLADGRAVVEGSFRLDPIRRVWPTGEAIGELPAGAFGSEQLRSLPVELRDALMAANVGLGAVTIESPRRRWGHLFLGTGLMGGFFLEEDGDRFMALTDQMALLLDAADLLVRTVAVERSLAHAEKLAAIGELAARMAHEIRNPVTAARSLAQQLAREPTSPLNAEHAELIVEELERVERHVRDLLRYARREELRPETIDLGGLVRGVTRDLATRIEQAGVEVTLDIAPEIVAPADREKLRQVMINLIENALDALAARMAPRRLALSVTSVNGAARLRVADNGPGVAADVLPRLFEPFFSLKQNGTGLGLAIVKRTIDAHGGSITAESREGHGTQFDVALPLARPEA